MTTDIATFDVSVLGPLAIEGADGAVDLGGGKPRLLLALLIANAGAVVTTEQLIDGLWGDDPPATARKTVQVHVSNLRKSVGPAFPLETTRAGYRIVADRVTIDAVEFERELREAEALRDLATAEASSVLTSALGRWRGSPYADLSDDAIKPEVTRLNELRLRAVCQRVDADLRLGRHQMVLGELETLTTDHPYHERLRELHMLALYRCGRQTEALRAFERTRRTLADELGLEPGPGLRGMHQRVLEQSADLDLPLSGGPTDPSPIGAAVSVPIADVGATIRGYELRERLGASGPSTVFRAYQVSVGREVALRVIAPEVTNQPDFVKRFEYDHRLLAQLAHPHIVGVHDFWRDPGGAYVAMPLMRGGTLAQSLARGVWHPHAMLRLFDQVGGALAHAHRRGVVHGDVRPSNVLLDEESNAFLSDFGLERIDVLRPLDDGGDRRDSAELYMSPERVAESEPDPGWDIYAIGVLACVTLTGVGPDDLAFARVEVPPAFIETIRGATDPHPDRRYRRIDDVTRALRRCFGADVVLVGATRTHAETRNPYKGLRAFQESDAPDYFGRESLVEEIAGRLAEHTLTAVVGPSGSGKSSLVRAGVLPIVRRQGLVTGRDVVVVEMFPGSYPFEELATALERVAVRGDPVLEELMVDERGLVRAAKKVLPDDDTDLLLLIDQFEELFVLTPDERVRRRFIDNLVAAAGDPDRRVRILVTLRADFFGQPLEHPAFGELLKASLVPVALPDEDALARAISEPARRAGLDLDPGLIPTILRDVADQPGGLPMLQYSLTELAAQSDGEVLTIAGYERTGGVVGAVASRAEQIYADLPPSGRAAARQLFVRLVSVTDDTDDARRRVRRTELDGLGINGSALEAAIDAYGLSRLLTFDHDPVTRGPTVEVAHEALIREWPRLREWVDEQRDDLRTERRLQAAVSDWRQGDRDDAFLLASGRLLQYEQWAASSMVPLTDDERAFLGRSREREDATSSAAARRRRRLLVLVSSLALLAMLAAVVAFVQRDRASDQARAAEDQTRVANDAAATAERLRAEADRVATVEHARALAERAAATDDPKLDLLLALEAVAFLDEAGIPDARTDGILRRELLELHIARRVAFAGTAATASTSIAPAGDAFAITPYLGQFVQVVDQVSGETVGALEPVGRVTGTIWNDQETALYTGDDDGTVYHWLPDGTVLDTIDLSDRIVVPLWVDDRRIGFVESGAAGHDPDLVVADVSTGDEVRRSISEWGIVWPSPDGTQLLLYDDIQGFRIHDAATLEEITPAAVRDLTSERATWSSRGDALWALDDGRVRRIDLATGRVVLEFEVDLPASGTVLEDPTGELLAVINDTGTAIVIFDARTGSEVTRLDSTPASPPFDRSNGSFAWLPRRQLASADPDIVVWDLGSPPGGKRLDGAVGQPTVTEPLPSGHAVVGGEDGVAVVDERGEVVRSLRSGGSSPPVVAIDAAVVAHGGDGPVEFSDLVSGDVLATAPEAHVRPLAISPDGAVAIVGAALDPEDRQHFVAIVDARSGRLVRRIGTLIDGYRGSFLEDGRTVLLPITTVPRTDDEGATSSLWLVDTTTGEVLAKSGPTDQACVVDVAVSDDDRLAANVGCDGAVSLFDLEILRGPEPSRAAVGGDVLSDAAGVGVAFGPGGDEVIVTFDDGSVAGFGADALFARLWSLDVGDHVGTPVVRDGHLWVGASSGPTDAPSSAGVMLKIPLDRDRLVELARASVGRELTDAECRQYLERTSCSGT